jgi:hypothetical protein
VKDRTRKLGRVEPGSLLPLTIEGRKEMIAQLDKRFFTVPPSESVLVQIWMSKQVPAIRVLLRLGISLLRRTTSRICVRRLPSSSALPHANLRGSRRRLGQAQASSTTVRARGRTCPLLGRLT